VGDKTEILLVEDDVGHAELIARAFTAKAAAFHLTTVPNLHQAQKRITQSRPDLIIMDFLLPDGTGMEFLSRNKNQLSFPVVLMTSHGDEQVAVEAMKAGALDYVVKSDVTLLDMPRIAERALREWSHIIERQQAESALQESEQRFRSVIEQSTDGIVLTDEEGTIIEWNQGMERLTGLTRQDAIGRSTWEVQLQLAMPEATTSSPEFEQLRGDWQKLYATGKAGWLNKVIDRRFHHLDGRISTVEMLSFPIKTEKGYMAGSIVRDVTASRQAEEQLRQQERLAAVGQLAAGIAHDFNNIMAVIVLYAQISLQTPNLPPRVQERMNTVVKQAKRAAELIEQILDFSRRTVLEKRPLNLVPLLKEQVKLLRRTVPENITIKLQYEDSTHLIYGDPTRLQQTVMNLALNARDAMSSGGELNISLEQTRFETQAVLPIPDLEAGDYVCLAVADTGVGISDEVKPRIYEPFFTTKKRGEGTGLGLSQVYGIVKQHEGYIHVQTKVGEGTTFLLYFPALELPQPDARSVDPSDLPLGQGETILLVEDDEAVRAVLLESLTMINYKVICAANGREALTLFEQQAIQPALIISDVIMPEMGGIDLLHALYERQVTLPMILISGHPQEQEITKLQDKGEIKSLAKPPDLSQLAQLISEMIDTK
jgi:PAS domain S-box-containing protein